MHMVALAALSCQEAIFGPSAAEVHLELISHELASGAFAFVPPV